MMKKITHLILALAILMPAFAGVREDITIQTTLVPDNMNITVVSPEGYPASTRFPVVYILNGFSGDNTSWIEKTAPNLTDLSDSYGFIFVFPDGKDSWYWDAPADSTMNMETFIINELVPYIDAHYPTKATASQRAITGLSMGGHGALWLGIRHPDVFSSAGSMSGGVDIRRYPRNWKIATRLGSFEEHPEVWDEHAVANLVPMIEPGRPNIIFDCGASDFFAAVNDSLHTLLLDANIPHDYTSRPGSHSHPYWRNSILYHLLYFNSKFKEAEQ